MSVDFANEPATAPQGQPTLGRRRRRARPGLTLLAQGEPMVWLTGGALVICLAMIVGLLGLIVCCGVMTFWPRPLVRVETIDGAIRLGEITRRERYSLSAAATENMSPEVAAAAQQLLAGREQVETGRRLFRTGNYQLTGEHFNWVSEFEVKPGSESRPEWAVIMERLTWGRFYGEPQQFALQHARPVEDDEQRLLELIQFFDAHLWRLSAEQGQALKQATAPLRQRYQELAARRSAEFVASFDVTPQKQVQVVLDDGQRVPRDEFPAQSIVQEVQEVWTGPAPVWQQYQAHHADVRRRYRRRRRLEKHDIGGIDRQIEYQRLNLKEAELDHRGVFVVDATIAAAALNLEIAAIEKAGQDIRDALRLVENDYADNALLVDVARQIAALAAEDFQEQLAEPLSRRRQFREEFGQLPPAVQARVQKYLDVHAAKAAEAEKIKQEIDQLKGENGRYVLTMVTADGVAEAHELSEIVRAFPANQLSLTDKLGVYGSRWLEFLLDDPREANEEGGVFPAIWGTVAMTLIMSLFVVPFGVLAALYLREYAKSGVVVSAVRIAINNLAGVPSIVFGVFGLGFFCYVVGAYVDGGPARAGIQPWPAPIWFVALAVLVVVSVGAASISLFGMIGSAGGQSGAKRRRARLSTLLWIVASAMVLLLLATTPFFDGFYRAHEHNPKFGKPGLLWASLTLALLTLPVVIVATEEALAAVPNSLREASYACGAGKWQTILRVVLPHAVPGIMTGMILAMARGAGEVAPLMLVGALNYVKELPVDSVFPFIHADRSFMHLGFHIYDVGFQSQNSEAAKQLVFTITLLLITIIGFLNISAVALRARLRRRFHSGQF